MGQIQLYDSHKDLKLIGFGIPLKSHPLPLSKKEHTNIIKSKPSRAHNYYAYHMVQVCK